MGFLEGWAFSYPRDPLLHSERTQGFAADPDYWKGQVFAYVGLPQNLKDLKDHPSGLFERPVRAGGTEVPRP